ncbi:hypothetical protein PTTG_06187 [Puccinia triticina 1-1 BBBD Race 1]|uniref:Helicase ATP-binding domain-containing protein n=1 Tax=Puccinia triticina (isolate 1-1 / race 1 (BBBD)) TaxID=630390 RepID=A0A180GCZ5_PUCT1|nr:hypothetical protein PTTG_06187 [Puccinia triticina 1-1 BBBD Race 1]
MTGEPLTNSERIQEGHSLLMLPDPFQQDRPKQTRPKDVHFFVLSAPLQKRLCQLSAHPRTDVQAARDEHPIDLLQQSPGTDTFVGTPGRVNALICDGLLKCNTVCTFVLEECDKMLKSVDMCRNIHQVLLARPHAKQPLEIYVDEQTKLTLHGLQQNFVQIVKAAKNQKLHNLLDTLEFNQEESIGRNKQFKAFKKCILIRPSLLSGLLKPCLWATQGATDIFGQGFDIERINIVINYNTRREADPHAGRFGTKGVAITFVASKCDQNVFDSIQARLKGRHHQAP